MQAPIKTILLVSLFIASCSSVEMIKPKPDEPLLHSTPAVLDLGRSAYLKGCVDGFNKNTKQSIPVFEICLSMAKTYEVELKEILESKIKENKKAR